MKRAIHHVLIIENHHKKEAAALVTQIEEYCKEKRIQVTVKNVSECENLSFLHDIDLAFSLGGDGTVLFSSRKLSQTQTPILAVNLGNFGFITEISKDEWMDAFEKYQAGFLGISKRIMVEATVQRGSKTVNSFLGLNDIVIGAAGISKIVTLHVSLSYTALGEYRADGVILSTPTGSTAYSAATGGPILDPEMEALIINPISPFTLSNRPIVVPGNEKVLVTVDKNQRTDVLLTVDGQYAIKLQPEDRISVTMSDKKASIIRSDKRNFYEVLRTKLNWSGGPDA